MTSNLSFRAAGPKRRDAHGRIYYLSPEVMLGSAQGRLIDPSRLWRLFRLRQLTRLVRQPGHIRLHHFGLYVDPGLWGQTVEVLIYDEALRIEQAEHLLVSYPCVYDTRQRRITAVDGTRPAAVPPRADGATDALGPGTRPDRVADAALSTSLMASRGTSHTASRPLRVVCKLNQALGQCW
jgi:hypothetical protein